MKRRGLAGRVVPACLAVAGALLIASVRQSLATAYHEHSRRDEVSLILSPEHTVVFSLGHREALADYLFATLLVQYGIGFRDKRVFRPTFLYLDTITTLAPTFDRPYLFADTLLTMLPVRPAATAYRQVRRLHERGLKALPFHSELWSVAGQFATYLAPQYLPQSERSEFKLAGARAMARACELISDNENIPYHCITAAGILDKSGEREAMIRMLSRTLAVNDDPRIRQLALGYLKHAVTERERERYERRLRRLEATWKQDLPHVSRTMISLLGPGTNTWRCAGFRAASVEGCASTWRAWGEAGEPEGGEVVLP